MAQCNATTKGGKPCPQSALPDSDRCYMHAPERAAERAEARRKGGLNRRTSKGKAWPDGADLKLRSVEDVQVVLEQALADTILQENSGSRTQGLVRVAMAALKALEVGELEVRMAALEARLEQGGPDAQ